MNNPPKLFVVGCPRSGTSWVTNLIASHPKVVAIPAETHLYRLVYEPFVTLPNWSFQRRLRSWKGILRRYGLRPLLFGWQTADIWRGVLKDYQILNRPNSHGLHILASYDDFRTLVKTARASAHTGPQQADYFISALLQLFCKQHGMPDQTLLEKTPMHIRYVAHILDSFPEARIIEVIRDGRDVCSSYAALAQTQPWARIGTAGAIRQWKRCVIWGEQFRAQPPYSDKIHVVRYEQLSANPGESLKQIFDFAQLDWNSTQIDQFIAAADISKVERKGEGEYTNKGIVGNWQQSLSPTDISLCEEIAGEQLTQLGYD